jgi:hypothetical protein
MSEIEKKKQKAFLTYKFLQKFSSKFNPVFLTYIKVAWIICLFIILYNCVIAVIIWLIKKIPCFKWLWKAVVGDDSNWISYGIGTLFELFVKNVYVLTGATILFQTITILLIVFYIALLICLFIYSIIPWPFVTDRQAPRKWEFFRKLKEIFDLFEGKIFLFTFINKSFAEMFAVFYGGKKEKFVNMPSLSQNMKQLFAQFQIGPYIEEIDKNHYEATKSFRDRKDYYNVGYILALTHTAEANIINKIIISTSKETYEKNSFKNNYLNNGFEENVKKAFPM